MDSIRELLKDVWAHINNANWDDDIFDWNKAAVCATFAQIAYLAIPEFEFEKRGRFKLIPSTLFQNFARSGQSPVEVDILRRNDSQYSAIVYGRQTVTTIARMGKVIFLAVRGTSTLYNSSSLYDWRINIHSFPPYNLGNAKLHRGFLRAALENIDLIRAEIDKAAGQDVDIKLYITGHSLGGAVASILQGLLLGYFDAYGTKCQNCGYQYRHYLNTNFRKRRNHPVEIHTVYTFGMPRYGDFGSVLCAHSPYHIFHDKDIVPRMPSRLLGYVGSGYSQSLPIEDFKHCLSDRNGLCGRLIRALCPINIYNKIMWYHCIENYRAGIEKCASSELSKGR